jgi:hypothetical protein
MHMSPRSRQVFQMLQIAITMVMDLKYDKFIEYTQVLEGGRSDSRASLDQDDLILTEQRAYLGCCYLSSSSVLHLLNSNS